jgi:ribosomal protein S11
MTNPMIRIHDISTNTITDREMTDEEFAQYEADQAAQAAQVAAEAAKAEQKSALLERLGITAEEAQLLLGGN